MREVEAIGDVAKAILSPAFDWSADRHFSSSPPSAVSIWARRALNRALCGRDFSLQAFKQQT